MPELWKTLLKYKNAYNPANQADAAFGICVIICFVVPCKVGCVK